jgi:hypothetical protein
VIGGTGAPEASAFARWASAGQANLTVSFYDDRAVSGAVRIQFVDHPSFIEWVASRPTIRLAPASYAQVASQDIHLPPIELRAARVDGKPRRSLEPPVTKRTGIKDYNERWNPETQNIRDYAVAD